MRINHNIAALNTYRQLTAGSTNASKNMEKLSSGLRINRAGDDAAGLAISEKMRGQIRGLEQASRNAQDGISLIQTAEGALNETHSILQRMRELAVQASNDTNTDADRSEIQKEVNQLADELNRIGNNTEFNTRTLLDGSLDKVAATSAKYISNAVAGPIEIRSSATEATLTGTTITPAIEIHGDKNGKAIGNIDINAAVSSTMTIDSSNNELTFTLGDGTTYTAVIDVSGGNKVYDGNPGQEAADFISDLQTALDAATGGTGNVSASLDANGYLVLTDLTKTGNGSQVRIDGGNMVGTVVGTATYEDGIAANNSLSIDINGSTVTHTLTNQVYNTVDDLVTELNTQFSGDGITFSNDSGKIVVTHNSAGSTNTLTNVQGSAAAALGLTNAVETAGKDANNQIQFELDGTAYTATVADGNYTDRDVLALTIQNAINTASTGSEPDVTVKADGDRFIIETGSTGSTAEFEITTAHNDLGLDAREEKGKDEQNVELNFAIGANEGQNLKLSIADMRAAALGITGSGSGSDTITGVGGNIIDVEYSANGVDNKGNTEYVLSVSTAEDAENAVTVIDNAIRLVSQERSKLGAYQNRLEHTINNLGTSAENLTAAESRIRDVDYALAA